VQRDEHLLIVLRYVLQNPVRSGLAASVDDWPWSSWCRNELADPCSVEVETNWLAHVDEPLSASQVASIRESVNRQRPFGEPDWQITIAGLFGLRVRCVPGTDPL
jgi:putative transposase